MTGDTDTSRAVVLGLIAQERAEKLRAYLARGRRYESLSLDRLAQVWIAATRAWSAYPFKPVTTMDDAAAEHELRGLLPPYQLVTDDLERAIAAIDAQMRQMSADDLRDVNARMVAEYEQGARSIN